VTSKTANVLPAEGVACNGYVPNWLLVVIELTLTVTKPDDNVGVAVAFTVAAVVATAAGVAEEVEVLLVQPVVDERTNAPIKSKGSAYFNGILIYRFIILTIGFIIQLLPRHLCKW
jgi:hypothetical protein